ncbi:MAG: hypothetical protein E7189_06610 [Erysipelotrichaceae bacterium]|nr:hypothetical protein [Erysipelotrichaceae bacterium]
MFTILQKVLNKEDFMEQIVETIMPAVLQLAGTVLMCVAGVVGYQIKKEYNKYVDNQTKYDIVNSTVEYVEQVYKDIHGEEKLQKALDRASELLTDAGITVTTTELETLIEAAVNGFNGVFNASVEE